MADFWDKLARNYSNVMEKILQAFSDIADVLPRLDKLKATFPQDESLNQVVGLIFCDIIDFHRRTYKFFRRKAWHMWFAIDWGLFERRFKVILQKLALHCDLLDKEAAAAHFSEMKHFRDKRQLEVDTFEEQRQHQMTQDVFRWLSAEEDQQESRLNRISDERQLETCEWVLKDPQVQPWIEDDSGDAILWVTGIPGAGKSFLCSLLIENLQTQQQYSTLYYFFGNQSSNANTCATILRTLAYQILQHNLDMASLIHQAYLQKGSNRSGPAMKRLLTQILPSFKSPRIIIDGIDESDPATQQEVLKSLVDIQKSAGQCCKLLISSRNEPQIRKWLAAKIHMDLGEKTNEGLSLYIKDRVKTLQETFGQMNSELVSLAEQRLRSKANKMFLWVKLVTDMLICQASELDFESSINQLPDGLDAAYGAIKSRIDSLTPNLLRQRAFRILYWICVARRPISLYEIADGIVLHPGQTSLNRKTRSNNPVKDIVELCAPLLEKQKNGIVDVVHFSAKEYFIDVQSGNFVDVAKAHLNIAFSCVINLTACFDFVPRGTDGPSDQDLESRVVQGSYGLQSYAQDFWAEHVLAYLGEIEARETDAQNLISALETFSQVWKHRANADISLPSSIRTVEASLGLKNIQDIPWLYRFISSWLRFKSESNKIIPSLDTLVAQQQWRLKTDETFLSLIDTRLCTITERLLLMQSSELPSHIDKHDFQSFASRYSFVCRFQGCSHYYATIQERDSHESSHTPSFPCLQCDFSGRGFRSLRDLERHTQKYHMSPEDFEIPHDLHMGVENPGALNLAHGPFRAPSSGSGHWTERGRRAIQQGFQHVLARLESEMKIATGGAGEPDSKDITSEKASAPHIKEPFSTVSLDSIKENVEQQKYESLADFKTDLDLLSQDPAMTCLLEGDRQIGSICNDELAKSMSTFPAFSNFDHTGSRGGNPVVPASNCNEESLGHMRDRSEQKETFATADGNSFGTRIPYWSLPEGKKFPELLQRYGRDFVRIAYDLKTKTPEEVDRRFFHLLRTGNKELADLADLAEVRLQRDTSSFEDATESRDTAPEIQRPEDHVRGTPLQLLQLSQPSNTGPGFPLFGIPPVGLAPVQGTRKQAEMNIGLGETIDGPIRKKRRPAPRVPCPHCSLHTKGLRDEWALKKHIERFHTATRNAWICDDISIDKRFLTRCKSCSASKRYSSKNNAGKHLRKAHFTEDTSPETLQRWMRQIQEPNPNMRPSSSVRSISTTETAKKRQKKEGLTISLPILKSHLDSSRILPSMMFESNNPKPSKSVSSSRSSSSLDDDLDEDEELATGFASFETDIFLDNISFDNVLPGTGSDTHLHSDGPPHRINRALIRPDQVSRLPNLDHYRKTVCLDQVEALYHKLDNVVESSLDYKEALQDLTSLSRCLMRNLRDWRKGSTLAPHIPFSI